MRSIFKEGDKAVCINSKEFYGLVEGKTYTVKSVSCCPKCGEMRIDVGLYFEMGYEITCDCGIKQDTDNPHPDQERFAPTDINDALESEIFESLKGTKILN